MHKNYSAEISLAASKNIKETEFWLKNLSGELVKTNFPYDHNETNPKEKYFDRLTFACHGTLFSKMMKIVKGSDVRLHMILVAAVVTLLNKYTGLNDIILGVPVYRQEIEGNFVNTVLVLRNRLKNHITFKELLLQVRQTIVAAAEHQNYPLETLLYKLDIPFSKDDTFPLFEVVVLLENIHDKRYILHTNPNIVFSFTNAGHQLNGTVEYNTSLYEKSTVERIVGHLLCLLRNALFNIDSELPAVEFLSLKEREQLLVDFNNTEMEYPAHMNLAGMFEQQVEKTPDRSAVVFQDRMITYRELSRQANRLAGGLRENGVTPGAIVAIMEERSIDMIVDIWGILTAGGAYLPFDLNYPQERILHMLRDCEPSVLLVGGEVLPHYTFTRLQGLHRTEIPPRVTASRVPIKNLDTLPIPDRSLIDMEKYARHISLAMGKGCMSIQATRGCPYDCAYCAKLWPKNHVARSAENIFAEVKRYYDMGVRRFSFIDDIFNLKVKNSTRFFELVIENGLDIQILFPAGLRGDIMTKEYIDLMVKAGTINISVALETASPRLQQLIKKNLNIEKLWENLQYICKTYPHVILDLFTMHGFPSETETEALMTLDFIKSLKWLHFPLINILKIYPNTDMEKLALANGITREAIIQSENAGWHEYSGTLPFDKNFTSRYQSDFLNDYFLLKERLLHVLPYQMQALTEDELVSKYNSYLSEKINNFDCLLEFFGIKPGELGVSQCADEEYFNVPNLNEQIRKSFPKIEPTPNALRVLLLDLSHSFPGENQQLEEMIEAPLGLMYLMTWLKRQLGSQINGKIAKSGIDFENYSQLYALLEDFQPDVIGIRTLTFYKEFFHRTVSFIKQWRIDVPVIVGGPYATNSYLTLLQDGNIDLVVFSEGEITFTEVIEKIIECSGKLPGDEVLGRIPGIAFIPREKKQRLQQGIKIMMSGVDNHFDRDASGCRPHLTKINQSESPAYVIYTSGSSGVPKGVMIHHRSVINLVFGLDQRVYKRYPHPLGVAQVASPSFDGSVKQIFAALLLGHTLDIIPEEVRLDGSSLLVFYKKHQIEVSDGTPIHLSLMKDSIRMSDHQFVRGLNLKHLIIGGDILPKSLVKAFYHWFPGDTASQVPIITNVYGPTECTVDATSFEVTRQNLGEWDVIPIGTPISNVKVFILNREERLLPVGVPGELYIAGDGVAGGYLNRPELTAEKFSPRSCGTGAFLKNRPLWTRIPQNLSSKKEKEEKGIDSRVGTPLPGNDEMNQRLWRRSVTVGGRIFQTLHTGDQKPLSSRRQLITYKTGDLGRWRVDGNIQFLGRVDRQVKIRGYRIELEEIENQLRRHQDILDTAVVIGKAPDGEQCIFVYAVSANGFEPVGIRKYLSTVLPLYMMPGSIVLLERIPYTPNGKVDKRALPEPEPGGGIVYAAPVDEVERRLVRLWSEVLLVDENKISRDTDFFEIGGHSLKSVVLISKIHKELDVKIPVAQIFKIPTIKGMGQYIKEAKEEIFISIENTEEKEYYPLSSPQKRLYIMQQMDPGNTFYNIPYAALLEGDLDRERLGETFKKLVKRHESLRTSFEIIAGEPVQRIHKGLELEIENDRSLGSCQARGEVSSPDEIERRIRDFIRPFDLSQAPLLRVGLVEENKTRLLVLDMHHIISDGISTELFVKEFMDIYGGRELSFSRLQYKDYSVWQTDESHRKAIKHQEDYWLNQFKDEISVLNLPTDYPRPAVQDFAGSSESFTLTPKQAGELNRLALKTGTTLYMVLLAIYNILLSKLSGQEDIIVGTPTAGRGHAELQETIGMFVNTLAMRNYPKGDQTFLSFLEEIKNNTLGAFENQDYQFEDLVEKVLLGREAGRNPLFDTMFDLFAIETDTREIKGEKKFQLKVSPYETENRISKFDLSLDVKTAREKLLFSFEYSTTLFKKETIQEFILYFEQIVSTVVKSPGIILSEIEIISQEEKKQVLIDFNRTACQYPEEATIQQLFATHVQQTPQKIAVVFRDSQLTYGELDRRAICLARHLKERGVKQESIVAVMVERSLQMIAAVMAVGKAGGAYLPIDPSYPQKRIVYMLKNSGARILLSQEELTSEIDFGGEIINIDEKGVGTGDTGDLELTNKPGNLAYVIYTSGSTGKPKGIMVQENHFVNATFAWRSEYGLEEMDVHLLQIASFSFDVFSGDLARTLPNGGKLVICPEEVRLDPELLYQLIRSHRISLFESTPSIIIPLMEYVYNHQLEIDSLELLILGSDICPVKDFRTLVLRFGSRMRIINSYGVTEATIDTSYYEAKVGDIRLSGNVPIGKPMPNMKFYIMNTWGNFQPIGIPGELYIGGAGVARGYLNREELSRERFLPDPVSPSERVYKTGDLARWLWDGNVELLGRVDYQIKIRGYRIEVGEIENQLVRHQQVKEAVVQAIEDAAGEKYLCAYFVPHQRGESNKTTSLTEELRNYLSDSLPGYMIPNYFVLMEKIPLTPNGKIDKKALSQFEISLFKSQKEYVAPRDETEKKLIHLWSDILSVKKEKISIDSNFFQLGGHSLKAAILAAKIHKEFNVKLPLAELFRRPTIKEISRYILKTGGDRFALIEPAEKRWSYALSSAQKRLYIQQQMDPASILYNMFQTIPLWEDADIEKIERVFNQLIHHHESLRTSFHMINQDQAQPMQRIHEPEDVELQIEYFESRDISVEDITRSFVRPFDLEKAPLLRLGLIKTHQGKQLLLLDMHHLITDGSSNDILIKDFLTLYKGGALLPLPIQYKDFSQWQNSKKETDNLKQQEDFWLKEFAGDTPILNLPADYVRPAKLVFEGHSIGFVLNREMTGALNKIAGDLNSTLFMIIYSLFNIFLSKLSCQEDFIVGTVIAGRNHTDLLRIIGMFVNTLAIRCCPSSTKTYSEFLSGFKERTLQAFDNQDYPFEDLVDKVVVNRDASRNPLFDVVFVYQNLLDRSSPRDQEERIILEIIGNLEWEEHSYDNRTAQYDLTLVALEKDGKLYCNFNYCTRLFKRDTIERFIVYFKEIVSKITTNTQMKLSGMEIISEEEKKQIIYNFNNTKTGYPASKTIPQLFEEQVKKTPGDIALRAALDLKDIYEELDSREVNSHMFQQLETCCFKKNNYIFACDLNRFDETNPFTLLKTYQHNIAVVNNNVMKLIDIFDGEKNLADIYSLLCATDLRLGFLIYSININDVLEISFSSHKKEEFLLGGRFEDFIALIKSLYQKNFIQLVKINPHKSNVSFGLATTVYEYFEPVKSGVSTPDEAVENKEVLEDLLGHKKDLSEADILLLGDTPGQSTAGLLYLASYLRRNGIKAYCHFNDSNWETALLREKIEELLMKIKPRIVGVSMKWFLHIARVLEMCKIIKEYSERNSLDIRVVLGGNSASYFWKDVIHSEYVDCIIRGDGELPFLKLCRGEKPIPNCVYKEDGQIIESPITYIQNAENSADIYLSHMDEIMISDYSCVFGIFFIFTQKGCRKSCHYCGGANPAQQIAFNRPGLFRRNVSEVRKDIIESQKYASTIYFLFDDYSNESLLEYCKAIWEGIDLTSHFGFLSNVIPPSPQLIEYANQVFKYVYWNLDMASMAERHRKQLYSEGMVKFQPTDQEVLEMFDECEKYENNEILINIITGLPYFNQKDIEASKKMLTYIMNNYSCFGEFFWARLHAEPGAPVIGNVDKYEMYSLAKTFEDFFKFSTKNLKEFQFYPNVDTFVYPYIYFKDEDMNSAVSRYYAETYTLWEQYRSNKRKEAVVYHQLSYQELNHKANRLAAVLRKKGVEPDNIVGIMAERSLEMIVGLLGILKASAAYLPLDPQYPENRLAYMIKDCHVKLLLSQNHLKNKIQWDVDFIDLGEINLLPSSPGHGETEPGHIYNEKDLAYIIFTSGSTGKPKGVAVEHGSIINTLYWRKHYYQFNQNDAVLQIPSFSFDSSVEDIFTPLISGARLVLIPQEYRLDLEYLSKFIKSNRITHFLIVPGLYKTFLEGIHQNLKEVKTITVAGENFTRDLVKEHFEKLPGVKLYNEYGPTENSVCSTVYEFSPGKTNILIGHPINNVICYILNKNGGLNPIGVPGELCLGGNGLARNYLNSPELSWERFVLYQPLPDAAPSRIYHSGDLARWLPDGNIEFLGRIDHQVKIRGFRVELGEIESQLRRYPGIKDAIVTTREYARGDSYLCAYIIFEKESEPLVLREYLLQKLPEYMVPSYFVSIHRVPLTANGKIDKKALPDPELKRGSGYTAARNRVEKKLVEIWSGVLAVAGQRSIGIDDNFFELGGHSLKAVTLLSRIHKELNVRIALADLFKTPTINGLAGYIKGAAPDQYASIEPLEKKEYYALSSAQKRLYILQQMDLDSTAYNIPQIISGGPAVEYQVEKLEKTIKKLINRHESLRTSFYMVDHQPVQRVYDEVEFGIEYNQSLVNCQGRGEVPSPIKVEKSIRDFIRPFDLSKAPLLRVGLINTGVNEDILMIDMHHIISDILSHDVLEEDFKVLHEDESLPPLRIQYKDFSQWQNSEREKEDIKRQEAYWLHEFSIREDIPVLDMPTDYPRSTEQAFEGKLTFEIPLHNVNQLKRIAMKENATLYMVLLTIYNILLSKLSQQEDIVIGTPVAGRRHADLEKIIGMFVNTLALRNYPRAENTFIEFLKDVKERTLKAFENQGYQFEDLVERAAASRDTRRNPLFDVMFALQNQEDAENMAENEIPNTTGTADDSSYGDLNSKFDLTLTAVEKGQRLLFAFIYNKMLFKRETVEKFSQYFKTILSDVLTDPEKKISNISVISDAERKEKISGINEDLQDQFAAAPIQDKLFKSFHKHRDRIAIEYGDIDISYSELDRRSATISHRIINNNIEKESFIGIYLDDKAEIITVMLGILKAGCVFIPLDSKLQVKRIEDMIRVTNTGIVFTDVINENRLSTININLGERFKTIVIDDSFYKKDSGSGPVKNKIQYSPEDKIYIYFTSGTTGTPGAIVGKNKSLLQFIQWEIDTFGVNCDFTVSQFTALGFDAFLRDVFTPLCAGGTVCIPGSDSREMDGDEIVEWLDKSGIRLIHCVPSLFRLFNTADLTAKNFANLKYVLLSGEEIKPYELENWYETFGERIQLVNLYGPTETTLVKTCYYIQENDIHRDKIPFGKPMRGTRIILLDKNKNICPPGIRGEIYIRTPYMTFGYYNKPELNKEKFIPNPFNHDNNDLIYKTGDLGRELEDGSFEFIGRMDRQVKMRGIRIELGEIESALLKHKEIQEAVVLTKSTGKGEMYLCAYIVSNKEFSASVLREYLSNCLPSYMIPSYFIQVDRIPLTPNGKVDKKALPDPEVNTTGEYTPPRNETEEKLAKIWSEVLGVELPIGIQSNFFELGGNSLSAVILISKIRKELKIKIPLVEIFRTPTIMGLFASIKNSQQYGDSYTPIEVVEQKEYYPLSSAQKRMFTLQQLDRGGIAYNMPQVIHLPQRYKVEKLEEAFIKLIQRHESLRTSFHMVKDELIQRIHHHVEFEIHYDGSLVNCQSRGDVPSPTKVEKIIQDFIRPFDLSKAPLLRVGLIGLPPTSSAPGDHPRQGTVSRQEKKESYLLMVDMHHIMSDAVSHQVLEKHFMALYEGESLSPLRIQYKDFSKWQNKEKESKKIEPQEEYWLKVFEKKVPELAMPTDYPRPPVKSFAGDKITFEIQRELTHQIKRITAETEVTLHMFLLAAYTILLSKYSGQEDIVVGIPIAGRVHVDLQNIIGMFVNMLAIRNQPLGNKTFIEFLEEVKENALNAYQNQDYQFEELVARLGLQGDLGREPLVNIVFQTHKLNGREIPGDHNTNSDNTDRAGSAPYEYHRTFTKYDLILEAIENEDRMIFFQEYSTTLFKRETIEKLTARFINVLKQVVENKTIKLRDISTGHDLYAIKPEIDEGDFGY